MPAHSSSGPVRGSRIAKRAMSRSLPVPRVDAIDLISSSDDEDALIVTGVQRASVPIAAAATSQPRQRDRVVHHRRQRPVMVEDDDDEVIISSVHRPPPSGRRRPNLFQSGVPLAAISVPYHAPRLPPVPSSPPLPPGKHCAICLDAKQQPACPPCGHTFCYQCLAPAVKVNKECPICRKKCSLKQLIRIYD